MDILRKWARFVSPVLAAALIYGAAPAAPAFANIVTTDRLIDLQAAAADRSQISGFLARDDVRSQVVGLGVDPADVEQRVAALSDVEARVLADKIDQTPGRSEAGLLILVAVFLFVVFAITDTMGQADVFPFINAQGERKP